MNTRLEVDYWVVDSDGNFAPAGALTGLGGIAAEKRDPASLLTVVTPSCESISALRQAFVERLEAACERADDLGRRLVPLATPINGDPVIDQPNSDRTRRQRTIVKDDEIGTEAGLSAGSGTNTDCASYCAGARVCVEQRSVTDQRNALLALTPALALVNSSPYVGGERVAAGARTHCYRTRSGGVRDDWPCRYVDSATDWTRRLEERDEWVTDRGIANGVDPEAETETESRSPADVGWTPIALREATDPPMLEWRVPDAALPKQLLELADDVATMMDRLRRGTVRIGGQGERSEPRGRLEPESDDPAPPGRVTSNGLALPRATTVADLVDAATYEGLESTPLAAYLERMGFAVGDYHPISARIDGRQYVSRADARELRLEYAGLLEADVADLVRTLE